MSPRLLQIVTSLDHSPDCATLVSVSRRMAAEGMEVTVLGLQGAGPLADELRRSGLRVEGIEPPIRHAAQLAYEIRRVVRDIRPDIVHTWSAKANQFGRLVAVTAHVPLLFASYRTIDPRAAWWTAVMNRGLNRYTRACVVNTQTAFDFYRQHAHPAEELRLIRDGVPLGDRATADQRGAVRERLGLSSAAKLIGLVGPLDAQQRIKDVIWSADLLRVFHSEIRLLIIGTGPDRWRLQRYATQVQDRQRTLFLGQRPDWSELIAALDCLCQAGGRETVPRAILHAMAVGVPVVATNTAGHRELIESEATGLLVPVGDRGALARQLQNVLSDSTLSERLASEAQTFVRRQHSEEDMLTRYSQMYRDEPPSVRDALLTLDGANPSSR
jgi:glycosyltransferase involved in cell wall biosynthesis